MKRTVKFLALILILLGIFLLIPFGIHLGAGMIKTDSEGWLSFSGSYLGGVLGGLCTLFGVIITINTSRKEAIKPFLVINFENEKKMIQDPNVYSEGNNLHGMISYRTLPSIAGMCGMKIINTGKGYAKDIRVTMLIRRADALLTDRNLFFISRSGLPDEGVKLINDNYVQKAQIPYISQEGGEVPLPVDAALNGIILSSIWNISYFMNFEPDEFSKNMDVYYKKQNHLPMTVPDMDILLEYSDLDDKRYQSVYRLGFSLVAQYLDGGIIIKPTLYFNNDKGSVQKELKEKREKEDRVTGKERRGREKLDIWRSYLYEAGIKLQLGDETANLICQDSCFTRYLYHYLKDGSASETELLIIFVFCCSTNGIPFEINHNKLDIILEARKKLLKDRKIRFSNKEHEGSLPGEELDKIKKLLCSKEELMKAYFLLFEETGTLQKEKIMIYGDSQGDGSVEVVIKSSLITDCGFYRKGYTYRIVKNQELIRSAIWYRYGNREIGFTDERGIYYDSQRKWSCIYLR